MENSLNGFSTTPNPGWTALLSRHRHRRGQLAQEQEHSDQHRRQGRKKGAHASDRIHMPSTYVCVIWIHISRITELHSSDRGRSSSAPASSRAGSARSRFWRVQPEQAVLSDCSRFVLVRRRVSNAGLLLPLAVAERSPRRARREGAGMRRARSRRRAKLADCRPSIQPHRASSLRSARGTCRRVARSTAHRIASHRTASHRIAHLSATDALSRTAGGGGGRSVGRRLPLRAFCSAGEWRSRGVRAADESAR